MSSLIFKYVMIFPSSSYMGRLDKLATYKKFITTIKIKWMFRSFLNRRVVFSYVCNKINNYSFMLSKISIQADSKHVTYPIND